MTSRLTHELVSKSMRYLRYYWINISDESFLDLLAWFKSG